MSENNTVIRAFELPIHKIERVGKDPLDGWELLRDCWKHATMLANWSVQQLMRVDVVRLPGMEKLPNLPEVDLYALVFGRKKSKERRGKKAGGPPLPVMSSQYEGADFFAGACASANNILQGVRKKYEEERWDVVWHRSKSPCSYRYPHPWPVHNQQWTGAGFDEAGKPWVLVSLPGGPVKITLRGGREFGRQLALFKDVVAEFALAHKKKRKPKVKQLVIRQQPTSNGCHRPTMQDGGKTVRAMCKMVAEVPVREKPGDRTLVLLTDPGAFWVALLDGRPAWIWNGDDYKTHMARLDHHSRHLCRLQRMSEDAKMERRTVVTSTSHFTPEQKAAWDSMSNEDQMRASKNRASRQAPRLERMAEKDRRRLDSWTHETAAHLIGFCVRQRVGEVFYLDRDKGFMERFPWHQLHSKVADKLKAAGIDFYSESKADARSLSKVDSGEPVTTEERVECLRQAAMKLSAVKKVAAARKRPASHPSVTKPTARS